MRQKTKQAYEERILRVLIYIQTHLDKKLSLKKLAEVAEFSPYHFHRIFHSIVGETVKEYVRRLRLERAARDLKNGTESVTSIAFQAGYETHESFSRAFRVMFGESPSGFRKKHRADEHTIILIRQDHIKKLQDISDGIAPSLAVDVVDMEPSRVAFIRHVGPYEQAEQVCEQIIDVFQRKGMFNTESVVIGIPYDDPQITPKDKIRYDACIVVDDTFTPSGEIGVQYIAGGKYAVAHHVGGAESVEETFRRFYGDWLPLSKRELRSEPLFLKYLFSEKGTITAIDIYFPLSSRNSY